MPIISENWRMRRKHNLLSKLMRKYYNFRVNMTKPAHPITDSDIVQQVARTGRLVIQVPFGGLGDHLAYSSLPELLWEQKRIKTFISNKSIFRSAAIRDFVWGLNPYVEFTDEKGWFTYQASEHNFSTLDEYLQSLFGLKAQGCPKIYYKPKVIEQVKAKVIVDPSFGPAGKANKYYEPEFRRRYIEYLKNIGDFVLITHQHGHIEDELQRQIKSVFNPPCYTVSTIEALADVLFSASERYLMYSGAASLAAAMGLPSTVLCSRKAVPTFQYRINNYVDLRSTSQPETAQRFL